eukprot:CAMPEP_0178426332 /NCGR_PEP_ID=MMETSP0689_2-20121128/29181_1 /TAXON_ID=160604 /ORGANISM="Amphidinium massartii, Strain CS-259" /LENGTH=372 /DNA_ID=CAMNT_0020048017 /DNA_START=64 /DNA_END=1182 /DNA_ORIENTATION=-
MDKFKENYNTAQTSQNATVIPGIEQDLKPEDGFFDQVRRLFTPAAGATQERPQKGFSETAQAAMGAWDQLVKNTLSLEYDYKELAAGTSNFSTENRLGAGAAGAVYRGKLRGVTPVAVKVLKDMGGLEGFEDEVRVLSRLRHINLVTLMGFARQEGTKYLVYELLPGGDLHGKLQKSKTGKEAFPWQERLQCALHVAKGLSHMMNSRPKTFHRDIKSPNILIEDDGTAKVADFGLAGVVPEGQSHVRVESKSGTPGYCCPSYMQSGVVSEKSEVYSYGMVLFELLLNVPPALQGNEGELVYPVLQQVMPAAPGAHSRVLANLDPTAGWTRPVVDDFADLALTCIDDQPERRPVFLEIIQMLEQTIAMGSRRR